MDEVKDPRDEISRYLENVYTQVPGNSRDEIRRLLEEYFALGKKPTKAIEGEYAYYWSDLFSLEDLLNVPGIVAGGASAGIVPLIKIWIKHRSTRVKLSANEALVLKTVKSGSGKFALHDVQSVLQGKIDANEVNEILRVLLAKKDSKDRPVMDYDETTHTYSTEF